MDVSEIINLFNKEYFMKLSEDMSSDHVLQKSKLRQDGLWLLKYVQEEGNTFSIQRTSLIKLLEING